MVQVLIYTAGDARQGMGHVQRCLTLADELKLRGMEVAFVTIQDTPGSARLVERWGNDVYLFAKDDFAWVPEMRNALMPRMIVVDIADGPSREMMELLRSYYEKVIVISAAGYLPPQQEVPA